MASRFVHGMVLAAVAIAGAGAAIVLTHGHRPVTPKPALAAPAAQAAPADCLLPGPPPIVPHGADATVEEMNHGHDYVQRFVDQLEAYQACRNAQIDHAPPGVTPQQKQVWVDQGNEAVDAAKAIAAGFSEQRRIFNARNGTR